MNKIAESLNGLILSLRGIKSFNPDLVFNEKRVAIVGPADSALEKENGKFIDQFDYIIRINKAPSSWQKENEKYLGTRTDIWFHSFFENQYSGGGPLAPKIFNDRNIGIVVNPRTSLGAYRRTFNFYRKYKLSLPVYHLSSKTYHKLINKFSKGLRPTVGFTALYSALNSPCEELYITGFTFFKTPYSKGYRDHLIDPDENKKHFKNQGIHNAELEYQLFKQMLPKSKCKKVQLDNKLQKIIDND